MGKLTHVNASFHSYSWKRFGGFADGSVFLLDPKQISLKGRCPSDSRTCHIKSFHFREAKEGREKFWSSYSGVKTAVSVFFLLGLLSNLTLNLRKLCSIIYHQPPEV